MDGLENLDAEFNVVAGNDSGYSRYLRTSYKQRECACRKALHAHLGDDIVFTGTWAEVAGERELEEEELLEGEISASVFTVGCYAVWIAECLYEDDGLMRYADRIPAGQDKIAKCRKERRRTGHTDAAGFRFSEPLVPSMGTGVRKVMERIDYICTVKQNDAVPDGQAVLFVLKQFTGNSYSGEYWYKFTPDGRVEEYRTGGYGKQDDAAAWEL